MEPLKNGYSKEFFDRLCQRFKKDEPSFDIPAFQQMIFDEQWEQRELKERMRHITLCLHQQLQRPFQEAINLFKKTIESGNALYLMFYPDYVEVYGQDDLPSSLDALEYFTPFASAEFAIRPFIHRYGQPVMDRMKVWAKHTDEHVRRLASEGCRPRLPWAMALPEFKKDPHPILPILEQLRDDPSEYVRRSVANNLNDISKDHPELVLQLAEQWQGKSKATDWVIRHGLRSLLKNGHPRALAFYGYAPLENVDLLDLKASPNPIQIGQKLDFSFELHNHSPSEAKIRMEYSIDYVKKNGGTSRKLFKLAEKTFPPGKSIIRRQRSFQNYTTRTHYPGSHRLLIYLNGEEKAAMDLEVLA
jgi:3-methyladenine DNA glycosylase AlkC